MWQYIIVAAIIGWAVYYLWKTYARRKGCGCGSSTCSVAAGKESNGHQKGHPGCCSGQATLEPMTDDTPQAQNSDRKESN